MTISNNISLKSYNTFGIDVLAKEYIKINSTQELQILLKTKKDFFILSGGSNILLTKHIDKLVVHLNSKGINIVNETNDWVEIKVEAGENWHEFVLWCLDKDYGGLENLSLIPGNVGTSPIQNIGAYGVEVKDVITKVEAVKVTNNVLKNFSNKQCKFGYRNSVFKNELKGEFIVSAVYFKLTKRNHKLQTNYGAIENQLLVMNVKTPTIKDVSNAVVSIRSTKLPDPKEIGNSGSFFKNPVISTIKFNHLKSLFAEIPSYPISKKEVKVPAGWLIEKAGFKGKRFGDAGIHKNQALVLVNYGKATGKEIYSLALKIQNDIKSKFDIDLEMEVNVI